MKAFIYPRSTHILTCFFMAPSPILMVIFLFLSFGILIWNLFMLLISKDFYLVSCTLQVLISLLVSGQRTVALPLSRPSVQFRSSTSPLLFCFTAWPQQRLYNICRSLVSEKWVIVVENRSISIFNCYIPKGILFLIFFGQ